MIPLTWPEPDPFQEAVGDSPRKRAQRAGAAGREVRTDRNAAERAAQAQIVIRLNRLKTQLQQRLLADPGGVTDFRRFDLQARIQDVDQLIAQAQAGLLQDARGAIERMADLGGEHAQQPTGALQIGVLPRLPGIDRQLVTSAFDNAADLLTLPMQQFATQTKQALRRVALAGDSRQEEIDRLRDLISGEGFESAAFKAERIIRTEVSRTFNEATYARLVVLAQQFPFLKKGWNTSRDNRVRLGHKQAGARYARGNGIPVAQRFTVAVYNESPGKAAKLVGTAQLRFPVDPRATPPGKVAAGATIMCRCNSFVDIDLAQYDAFLKSQTQVSVPSVPTGELPPAPEPTRPPAPRPRRPRTPRPKPLAATLPGGTVGPAGEKITTHLQFEKTSGQGWDKLTRAAGLMDQVHGVGDMPTIPVQQMGRREAAKGYAAGFFHSTMDKRARALKFTTKIRGNQPYLGMLHETGHFIDHSGIGDRGVFASSGTMSDARIDAAMDQWRAAVKNSQAIKTLQRWKNANTPDGGGDKMGDGTIPNFHRPMVNYLLTATESFARSYAQYVAVKSGDKAALAELRNFQAMSKDIAKVAANRPYNRQPHGKTPDPLAWDYPWQWQDDDFKPIEAAFDNLFQVLGWRVKK